MAMEETITSWFIEHLDRPVDLAYIPKITLLIVLWSFFAFTTVILLFRIAIRIWLQRRLFWDDAFAILAYLGLIAQIILVTYVAPLIYVHLQGFSGSRPPPDYIAKVTVVIRVVFAHTVTFTASLYCIKASFMALYWRLIQDLYNYRKAWWVVTAFCVSCLIVSIVLFPVGCSHLEAFRCTDATSISHSLVSLRFNTATDIATDLCIMFLPIVLIARSNLPGPQKVGLIVLFALGFSIIGISIARIVKSNAYQKQPPLSWLLFWGTMETSVAVITSCLATFKSLFNVRRRSLGYSYYSKSRSRSSHRRRRAKQDLQANVDHLGLTLPTISDRSQPFSERSLDSKAASDVSIPATARLHGAGSREEMLTHTSLTAHAGSGHHSRV